MAAGEGYKMNIPNIYSMINLHRMARQWNLKNNLQYFQANMTEAKVKRCAIIGLGFLVATKISPLSVLSLVGSVYAAYYFIKDYEDVKEVEMMREQAISSDFSSLIKEHGSIAQILDTKILTYKELFLKLSRSVALAKKNHSEDLPRLLQFEKQLKDRKDPFEKDKLVEVVKNWFSWK